VTSQVSNRRTRAADLLGVNDAPMAWQADADCIGMPGHVFFPAAGSKALAAKKICHGCPVKSECLGFALSDPDIVGIWGGTSHSQRISAHKMIERTTA